MSLRRTTQRPATQWTGDAAPTPRKPQPLAVTLLRMHDHTARMTVPVPKRDYVRSPALLAACRAIPCQHCGTSDGTVCAAHSNQAQHGKGRGIKASDEFVAALCFGCHTEMDQGSSLSRAERVAAWTDAHRLTVALLVREGLWPVGVAVPA